MTLLPSSSIAACGSGPSGPPKPISSSPLACNSSTLAITSSGKLDLSLSQVKLGTVADKVVTCN